MSGTELTEPDPGEALPPVTVDGVTIRVLASALITTMMTPREAKAFLRRAGKLYADEEAMGAILSMRPASQTAAVRKARQQSKAWFEAILPALLASIEKD